MRRVLGLLDLPKALLPLWLLAVIVVGGTAAGFAVSDGGAAPLLAAVCAAVVSWGASLGSRVALARRGRTGYEDMPSADLDYNDSGGVQFVAEMLNTVAWFGAAAVAYGIVTALGLEATGEVWLFPTGILVAGVAGAPALTEADARYGLRVRRRRLSEEAEIRGEPVEDGAPAQASVAPSMSGEVVVPLARAKAWLVCAAALASGIGCGALAAFADDMSGFERVLVGLGAPLFVIGSLFTIRFARAPYFLRLTSGGADLLGAGEIPWSAIAGAEVAKGYGGRQLAIVLHDAMDDEPWVTPALRRLAKRSHHGEVQAALLYSSRPAPEITSQIREVGRVDIDAYLA